MSRPQHVAYSPVLQYTGSTSMPGFYTIRILWAYTVGHYTVLY